MSESRFEELFQITLNKNNEYGLLLPVSANIQSAGKHRRFHARTLEDITDIVYDFLNPKNVHMRIKMMGVTGPWTRLGDREYNISRDHNRNYFVMWRYEVNCEAQEIDFEDQPLHSVIAAKDSLIDYLNQTFYKMEPKLDS